MIRRALIIYCNNTSSGRLHGPVADNQNIINHLRSYLGGDWGRDEIHSLNNPTEYQVSHEVVNFLNGADYSFTVFSGHGYINVHNQTQYCEIADGDISIRSLISDAPRQTILIDACRGFYRPTQQQSLTKGLGSVYEYLTGDPWSTRTIFDNAVLSAEKGITVLFAADENESALDSDKGGAYTFSFLKICKIWEQSNKTNNILTVKDAHEAGAIFMRKNFITSQRPTILPEKRLRYFPIAVKFTPMY